MKPHAATCGSSSFDARGAFETRSMRKPSRSLATAGTILLSGHLRAMASFGSPEGHSLPVGTSSHCAVTQWCISSSDAMDALLRDQLLSGMLRERLHELRSGSPLPLPRQARTTWCASSGRKPPWLSTSRARSPRSFVRWSAWPDSAWCPGPTAARSPAPGASPGAGRPPSSQRP
jgi:hypothetical protein